MGAFFDSTTVDACEPAQLQEWYKTACEQARFEDGHSGYSGTIATTHGLTIADKTFNRYSEGEAWIVEHAEKWASALVVKINIMPEPSEADAKKLKIWADKRTGFQDALRNYPELIIQRVKAGKSKTRGCSCGSQIAVAQIKELTCRYCHTDFLTTDTDKLRMEYLTDKLEEAKREFNGMENRIIAKAKVTSWKWLVGWWAAS